MLTPFLPYIALAVLVVALYLLRQHRRDRVNAQAHADAVAQGRAEPPSLHPVISTERCIGSGGCVHACPENALGIVRGKAVLVNASHCIGHGACRAACPVEAITLVFGTERRGIDIPEVTPEFESNVPGLYIAGELGGMGLIRKAAEQGRQAVESIRRRPGTGAGAAELDVMIVGAGPAGISAGLNAVHHKLRYRLIEQEDALGGTVYHYPRHKVAMTAPVHLAGIGKVRMGEIQKEKLLEFWHGVVHKTGLRLHFNERMENVERQGDGFVVTTNRGRYTARSVLLAIGRRGTPRKLGVPGEEQAKVVYRLVDAGQYRGRAVLVVGGGDSALEAALALADEAGTTVTLSYRSAAFARVKAKNRERVQQQAAAGRVRVLMASQVERIGADTVLLKTEGGAEELPNHAVIVCAGGELPTPLLQRIGVQFATKYGTA
ncbi:MAG: NAD(P)-binding domain-containing protein [Rubrivivax sp.]|nr:NAD(P)-binding domain-containing protein [Rubrivivax sp.]